MLQTELNVSLLDMVMCVSRTADLVSPMLADHQRRVAYLSARLATAMGLSKDEQVRILAAGALHDIGALSLSDKLAAFDFEIQHTALHTQVGATLLRAYEPLAPLADLVLHHHTYWDDKNKKAPLGAQLVHLADRIDVLLRHGADSCLLTQVEGVCKRIQAVAGRMFNPDIVSVFLDLAQQESLWLDLQPAMINSVLTRKLHEYEDLSLDLDALLGFTQLISHLIDFRSRFTATHSEGVAATAHTMGSLLGYEDDHCRLIHVAGYLHDLGKLAIPTTLLEKPGSLTPTEYAFIRSHTYHTYRSLEAVPGLERIAAWAAFHHERLDGTGYPFRLGGRMPLSRGSAYGRSRCLHGY